MPSTSAKQHRFMGAVANNSAFAKKAGVSQSVGKDFSAADKGKRFVGGGALKQKINRQDTQHGVMDMPFKSVKQFGKTVRRFQTGGSTDPDYVDPTIKYTPAQEEWLGKADRSDRYIIDRMKAARPTPAPVEERGIGPKTLAPVEERDISAKKPTETTGTSRVSSSDGKPDQDTPQLQLRKPDTPYMNPARQARSNELAIEAEKARRRGDSSSSAAPPPAEGSKKPAQSNSRIAPRGATPLSEAASQLLDRQPSGRSPSAAATKPAAKSPAAKPKIDAEDDDFARKIKKNKADDEAAADNVVDASLTLASMIPFVGPALRAGRAGVSASQGAKKATTAVGQYIPKEKLNTVYDTGRSLSGTNPRRLPAPPRRLPAPPRRLGSPNKPTPKKPRPDEDLDMVYPDFKKGGTVDTKKPNPFMEMIAKKKAMAKDKKPEMKFAKGGMARGSMPMKDGKPAFMKKMNMGGMAKYAKGGGIESHGKTKGTIIRMASGGSVGSASRRADGIAQRGKTRG